MSLFQKSVVNKYLKTLNNIAVEESYQKFIGFYGDRQRLENIKLLKEENYQEGKQQDEWEEYFNKYKTELLGIQEKINKTDNEIDQMVYKLYNLTNEEIKIVEGNI